MNEWHEYNQQPASPYAAGGNQTARAGETLNTKGNVALVLALIGLGLSIVIGWAQPLLMNAGMTAVMTGIVGLVSGVISVVLCVIALIFGIQGGKQDQRPLKAGIAIGVAGALLISAMTGFVGVMLMNLIAPMFY